MLSYERDWRNGEGGLPMTGMAGATASLKVKNLVPERRKIIKEIREDGFAFLERLPPII
jgi:histidinol-phosphate aminotransferase